MCKPNEAESNYLFFSPVNISMNGLDTLSSLRFMVFMMEIRQQFNSRINPLQLHAHLHMINDGLIFYQVTEFMYLVEGRKQERGDNFQVCVHSRGVRKTEFLCCQSRTILILLFFSEKPIAGAFCSRHLIKRFPIHRVQLGRGMALMSRTFYSNLLGDEINRSVCWTG